MWKQCKRETFARRVKSFDLSTNFLNYFYKESMADNLENLYVDIGVIKG